MKNTHLALIAVVVLLVSAFAHAETSPPSDLEHAVALMAKVGAS
jgi:hypothetical protein